MLGGQSRFGGQQPEEGTEATWRGRWEPRRGVGARVLCCSARVRAFKCTLLKPRNCLFHFPMKVYLETQHVYRVKLFGRKHEGETLLPSPPS